MGLALTAKGYSKVLRIGYGGFKQMRIAIAFAYSSKYGNMYQEACSTLGFASRIANEDAFCETWNQGCDDDLDILLWHSDCGGKFSPQECRLVLQALKKLNVHFANDNIQIFYNDFIEMLAHCTKRRVNLYFY